MPRQRIHHAEASTSSPRTESGEWVESETLRVWVTGYDGYVFGSDWHRDAHGE